MSGLKYWRSDLNNLPQLKQLQIVTPLKGTRVNHDLTPIFRPIGKHFYHRKGAICLIVLTFWRKASQFADLPSLAIFLSSPLSNGTPLTYELFL